MLPDGVCAAALMREVQLLAWAIDHLEFWSTERHAASEAVLLLQPMPDVLRNFIF